MNSSDKTTRLQAGEQVATAVRSKDNQAILTALVAAIEMPRVQNLSPTGRFNTLYMLNVQPTWSGASLAPRIESALDRMESETLVGGQTQHCIDMLKAKLRGAKDVQNVCGNVNNYFDKGG